MVVVVELSYVLVYIFSLELVKALLVEGANLYLDNWKDLPTNIR